MQQNPQSLSPQASTFYEEFPEIAQQISEQSEKGNFAAGFTPSVIEVKFNGMTYIRYENGEITASRNCSEGYVPPFWEVCFNEEETALFVLGDNEVLLDRTGDMAQLDSLMEQCSFLDKSENKLLVVNLPN